MDADSQTCPRTDLQVCWEAIRCNKSVVSRTDVSHLSLKSFINVTFSGTSQGCKCSRIIRPIFFIEIRTFFRSSWQSGKRVGGATGWQVQTNFLNSTDKKNPVIQFSSNTHQVKIIQRTVLSQTITHCIAGQYEQKIKIYLVIPPIYTCSSALKSCRITEDDDHLFSLHIFLKISGPGSNNVSNLNLILLWCAQNCQVLQIIIFAKEQTGFFFFVTAWVRKSRPDSVGPCSHYRH